MQPVVHRRVVVAAGVLLLAGAVLGPAPAAADLKPGGIMSSNVTWLGTLPIDSPGIGARVVQVGTQMRFYVTSSRGLSIYDVTTPTLPVLLGTVALPHWENEDVEVSADGRRVIISGDILGPTFIIDATNPAVPQVAKVLSLASHTVTCVDDACNWVYASTGRIYDLGILAAPRILSGSLGWLRQVEAHMGQSFQQSSAHDLSVDPAGYVHVDEMPRVMLDVSDPEHPLLKARSAPSVAAPGGGSIAYQHNNLRPYAGEWVPRPAGDTSAYQPGEDVPRGELLLANGESNFTRTCNGTTNGPFATWSLKNWDRGAEIKIVDVYRPVSGQYTNGDPAVNTLGCSGHWFDERAGLVTAAWYEHGTRFLRVDATGEITEVGFFQPVVGSAFASYFVTDDIVYTVDFHRGIDILRFDRSAPTPSEAEINASWLEALGAVSPDVEAYRAYCNLAVQQSS